MAGEIQRLLGEYGKSLASINMMFIQGKPTDKSQLYTAIDKIDPIKLAQNLNPEIAAKAAIMQTFMLPMEKTDYITEFIYKLNLEADHLIQHLTNISLNYTSEFLSITKTLSAVTESIIRNTEAIFKMLLYWNLLFMMQILYHVVVDVFWTITNLMYMAVWVAYASLFFTLDTNVDCIKSGIPPMDMHAPLNGIMILAVLIPWQILILTDYLLYIDIMMILYSVNYVLSILFLLLLSLEILRRRSTDILILFNRSLEQVTGAAGMIPLILSVFDSKTKGTAVLTSQLINPLPL